MTTEPKSTEVKKQGLPEQNPIETDKTEKTNDGVTNPTENEKPSADRKSTSVEPTQPEASNTIQNETTIEAEEASHIIRKLQN